MEPPKLPEAYLGATIFLAFIDGITNLFLKLTEGVENLVVAIRQRQVDSNAENGKQERSRMFVKGYPYCESKGVGVGCGNLPVIH